MSNATTKLNLTIVKIELNYWMENDMLWESGLRLFVYHALMSAPLHFTGLSIIIPVDFYIGAIR